MLLNQTVNIRQHIFMKDYSFKTFGSEERSVKIMKFKKTMSMLLSSAMIASALGMSAFAVDTTVSAPGAGTTPVTLTAEASTFNVTVPTEIPLAVKADGTVTVPDNIAITNNSSGPVKVTSVAMNNGTWKMTNYNGGDRSNLAAEKVGSKKLGLSLTAGGNAITSAKDGDQTLTPDSTKWQMKGKDNGAVNSKLPITIGAIATASDTAINVAETAANVIFTLAWDTQA